MHSFITPRETRTCASNKCLHGAQEQLILRSTFVILRMMQVKFYLDLNLKPSNSYVILYEGETCFWSLWPVELDATIEIKSSNADLFT